MAEDWVKFHRDLTRGKWSGYPRSTRFVLMELSLLCKPGVGRCELPPPKGRSKDAAARCVAMLGGDRREARRAVETLGSDGDLEGDLDDLPTLHFEDPDGRKFGPSSSPVGRLFVVISSWLRRNSRSKSAARMAELRARRKENKGLAENVTVTVTPQIRGDERRGDPPKAPPARKRKKAARPMPADWAPNETATRKAKAIGLRVEDEAEDFREWTAARGAVYVDWDAAFLSHLRRRSRDGRGNGGQRPMFGPEAVRAREEAAARDYPGVSKDKWLEDDP